MKLAAALLLFCLAIPVWADPPAPTPPTDSAALLAPEHLTQGDLSPEAYAFKQTVYRLHVAHSGQSGRPRIYDLPPEQLANIPGTKVKMRKDAAESLGRLLAAARADLAHDTAATGTDAETVGRKQRAAQVLELAVNNAYRSASYQFRLWDGYFANYLKATQADRAKLPGGEYGSAAADFMRTYVGVRVAAPGYSNHQGGTAVDFALKLKQAPELSASMAQRDPWKESWFWQWLNRRAAEFAFYPYLPEPWHWEYKPKP